jgi:diguanylate cyclase (GGDEF)-like protein
VVDPKLAHLTKLAVHLQQRMPLDALLHRIVDCAVAVTESKRASVRLLDPSGARLMAVCRAGEPMHDNPNERFRVGEGLVGWIAAERRPIRTGDAQSDPRYVARPGMRAELRSFVGVPLVSVNACLGVLGVVSEQPDAFTEEHEACLQLLAGFSAPHLEIARLQRLASVDSLTGALNRRGLDRAFPRAEEDDTDLLGPLSVCMLDIDGFRRINDDLGHVMGDEVLRAVVRRLADVVRRGDAVVRLGGDEFLLVLREVDVLGAVRIAERAREDIRATPVEAGDRMITVSVSIGVAERLIGEDREDLLHRADVAMRAAKHGGRGTIRSSMP